MEFWTRRSVLTAGGAALVSSAIQHRAAAQGFGPLFVRAARIIDPDVEGPARTADIHIRGGQIWSIGPRLWPPRGILVVDARGKFALPGLWDMHAHLAGLNEVGSKPEGYVGHGVLAVRDMGGYVDKLLAYKGEAARGRTGPALVFAGPTLNGESSADFQRVVRTEDEARTAVRELKALGVGLIKIHRAFKPDVLPALINEARKAGLPVAGHVPLGMDWAQGSEAGMHIEHLVTILENEMALPRDRPSDIETAIARIEGSRGSAIFARMAANRTWLDPTLVHYETRIASAPAETAAKARPQFERMKALVSRIHRAGVPILAGSDKDVRPGHYLLRELELLIEGGLSAREAVQAATTSAARAAGRPELAKIARGSPASFLLLDADPIAEVRNLRRLSAVVLGGRLLDAAELARLRALDA